ncbi:MAG TPA: YciI-like protein [Steroidobacteraceae bacterium]|nr:YciI-like protein [Steroidobacteraceae bacterium]
MHYLLFYDVVPDYLERRAALRAAHLGHARAACQRGELLLGGALAEPVDGAVLLFQGETAEVAERFARADPYVTAGLVTRWRVRAWTTVVGPMAALPASAAPPAPAPP